MASKLLPTSKIKLHPCTIAVSVAMCGVLTGCQSTPSSTQATSQSLPYASLFNTQDNPSISANAQADLLNALSTHMSTDHVSTTQVRYRVQPYISENSIDKGSDGLFSTAMQVMAYRSAKYDASDYDADYDGYSDAGDEPYRTEEDYLNSDETMYLAYDDQDGDSRFSSSHKIMKTEGTAESYEARTQRIIDYSTAYDDCIVDYSIDLDDLVSADASITNQDKEFTTAKSNYNSCVSRVSSEYQEDLNAALGYQNLYAQTMQQCAQSFNSNIDDIFATNRTPANIVYSDYDNIYGLYSTCYGQIYNKYSLEPNQYIVNGTEESALEYVSLKLDCAADLSSEQQALKNSGINFNNEPSAYLDIAAGYESCTADAYNSAYYNEYAADATEDLYEVAAEVEETEADADYDYEEYDDYEYSTNPIVQGMNRYGVNGVLEDYKEMKKAQSEQPETNPMAELSGMSSYGLSGRIGSVLDFFHLTPEQVQAGNLYTYQGLQINAVSESIPSQKRYRSVFSYDFDVPTMTASVQVPYDLDFEQQALTIDPSAIMPLVALISPENTPLPDEMEATTVRFELPEEIANSMPTDLLYDSFISGVTKGMSELNPEYFTAVDISDDDFADQIGASKAIKAYFGTKQSGELLGYVIKNMTADIKAYIDDNPDIYPDESYIKQKIDNWALYSQGYQSRDIGSLLQLVEVIAPISFDQVNYYYLDGSGRLIAKQTKMDLGSDLLGSEYSAVSQTFYDNSSFNNHSLNELFTESFGSNAKPSIDGNAWLQEIKDKQARLAEARYVRYDYEDETSAYDDYNDYDDYDYVESAQEAAESAAEAAAEAVNSEED